MKLKIECCKNCKPPKRAPGCHDKCKKYQDESRKIRENKKKIKKEKYANSDVTDFLITQRIITSKKKHII